MQQPITPFQGPAELVLSKVKTTTNVAIAGLVAVVAVMLLLAAIPTPSEATREVIGSIFSLAAPAFGAWYLYALSKAYRTRTEPVSVYADPRGLYLNGALVAPREELRVATIRLPRDTSEHSTRHGLLVLDATPMSVELITEDHAWNLVVGDLARSESLLAAMGFAPSAVPADHPRPSTRSEEAAQRPYKLMIVLIVGGSAALSIGTWLLSTLRR